MLFLSQAEIKELTGYEYTACQIKWLDQKGIIYLVGGDGKPKILHSHISEIMTNHYKNTKKRVEPNLEGLRAFNGAS